MAYSYKAYVGDGTTNQFSVPDYLDKDHIKAYLDGNETSYSWVNASVISFASAPLTGAKIRVQRETPISQKIVDFQNGNLLDEVSLDNNTDFLLFAVQESIDRSTDVMGLDLNGNYDAENKRITNVASPVNQNDAANMAYTVNEVSTNLAEHVSAMHNGSTVMVLDDEYDASTYLYLAERLNAF